MKNEILIEGNGLSNLEEFLRDEQENGEDIHIQAKFALKPNQEHLGAELISILLSGGISIITQILMKYFSNRSANDLSISFTDENGKTIKIQFSGKSMEEIKRLMADLKIKV